MAAEFLSICIPTRNRATYLRDVLTAFQTQIEEQRLSPDTVRVYVSDNASTDGTAELVQGLAARLPHFTYWRQPQNVGAERNVLACARLGQGRFCWISGDDELINPGALAHVLQAIADPRLALLIMLDTGYEAGLKRPARFATYRDFAAECARVNPHLLVQHTLLTSNVFLLDRFEHAVAEAAMHTNYPHMYGILTGLLKRGGEVLVSDFPAITLREQRAPAVDGVWPANLEQSWHDYLAWQREQFNLPELRPEAALEQVRRALLARIKKHPFRFLWSNLPALVQPQAYWYFLKRLWYHRRH
jgi:glycosyltransferase involved in cell wall biosynthesis